jgi:hypothetical protein
VDGWRKKDIKQPAEQVAMNWAILGWDGNECDLEFEK